MMTSNTDPWLRLAKVARVTASSEADGCPVEHAVNGQAGAEWRASQPGPQTIVLRFHVACAIRRIRLVIADSGHERTQEFTLTWSSHRGERKGVAVRQQFNFSPRGATRQVEDYRVELESVETLELRIVPDLNGGDAVARVTEFAVA